MAGAKGFEPSVFSVTGRRVNQATPRTRDIFGTVKNYHVTSGLARARDDRNVPMEVGTFRRSGGYGFPVA